MSTSIPNKVITRATNNVTHLPNGCIVSNYSTGSHKYAQIGWHENGKTKMVLIHRLVWQIHYGEIPNDMTVDHTCKTRKCINVDHMRLLSNFDNARRQFGSDWSIGFCKNGHSDSNLIAVSRRTKSGEKRKGLACSICIKEYHQRYRAKKRLVS